MGTCVRAAVLTSLVMLCCANAAWGQDTGTHVIVGVEPLGAYDVAVGGEPVPESPVTSSPIGILAFELDPSGLPPGPASVIISQNGDLIIGNVAVSSITESSAVVTWNTNAPASSRVDYGTSPAYGSSSPVGTELVTSHSVTLDGLVGGTHYHFRVVSESPTAGTAESGGHTFDTPLPDLVISGVYVSNVTSSVARIRWLTDRPSSSQVLYGATENYDSETALDPTLVTSHDVVVDGLEPDTEYHYAVVSVDANQYSTQSADATFTTAVIPLVVYDVTVSAGIDSAVVTWRTNRPADTRVEYGPDAGYGFETPLKTALVEEHSDTLRGLSSGETYHYRVRSEAQEGDVAYSEDAVFETELGPLVLTDIQAESGTSAATITWVTNRVADSQVEYGLTDAYGHTTTLDPDLVFGHEVELTGLDPGSAYHYRVRSEDEHGFVEWSDGRTFETDVPPPAIDGVEVTSVGVTWAVVEWNTDQATDGWVLFGTSESYGDSTASPWVLTTAHACTLTGLAEGTVHHFAVGARNASGGVSVTGDATFETMHGTPMVPPELNGPTARPLSAMSVLVTWTTDVPASSTVRFGVADGETTVVEDPAPVLIHEVLLAPVVPYVEYEYVVESCCPGGSATSEPCSFRTGPSFGESADGKDPLIIRPGIFIVGERDAHMRWATDRACSTWIEFGRDAEYGVIVPGESTGECGYECTLDGLAPGTEYHFVICAVDEAGNTVRSEDQSFQTLSPPDLWPPEPPRDLACLPGEACVELVWTGSTEPDLAGYNVYRVRMSDEPAAPGRTEKLNESLVASALFVDVHVDAGMTYAYQTTAVDSSGNESAHSASVSITLPPPPPGAVAFAQYPNPTRGESVMAFAVPGPGPVDVDLRVLSIDGRVVRRLARGPYPPGEHALTWDGLDGTGERAASGVYVCELRVDGSVTRRKMTLLR